jgi:hypothetical protein
VPSPPGEIPEHSVHTLDRARMERCLEVRTGSGGGSQTTCSGFDPDVRVIPEALAIALTAASVWWDDWKRVIHDPLKI